MSSIPMPLEVLVQAWLSNTWQTVGAVLPHFSGRTETDGVMLACEGHIIGTTWQNKKYLFDCPRYKKLLCHPPFDTLDVERLESCPSCRTRTNIIDLGAYLKEVLGGKV